MNDPIEDKYQRLDDMQDVMQAAMQAAIDEHHRCGRSVPIWQDERVKWLGPDGHVTSHDPSPPPATDH